MVWEMNELINHEYEEHTVKRQMLRLLRILSSFYSFRELEKRLDIPMQTLWKYHSLRAVPEKETAIKILRKISESRLLEEIVRDMVTKYGDSGSYISNTGFYELVAYMISDHVRELKPSKVFSMPDNYSSIIASIVAIDNKLKLCLSDQFITPQDSICTSLPLYNRPVAICYPRECFDKKTRNIVVGITYQPGMVTEIHRFLAKHKQKAIAYYYLYGDQEQANNEIKKIEGEEEKPVIKIFFPTTRQNHKPVEKPG